MVARVFVVVVHPDAAHTLARTPLLARRHSARAQRVDVVAARASRLDIRAITCLAHLCGTRRSAATATFDREERRDRD